MSDTPSRGSGATPARSPGAIRPELNGTSGHLAAVEQARARFGRDLEVLDTEVRAQVSKSAEESGWKLLGTASAILAGIAARKVIVAVWKALRGGDPPSNPADRETTWPEALGWAVATGVGIGVARLLAARGAAAGWERATGTLPPGLREVT